MVKRLLALLAAAVFLLLPRNAPASVAWRENTPAQKMLKEYIGNVNNFLTERGELEINTVFEMYDQLAVLGITSTPAAETPEGVEITVRLTYDSISSAEIRVSEAERFSSIAGAFLQALYPETLTVAEANKAPAAKARKALDNPGNSFEDEVEELNGTSPRTYYAYYPDQYHDGVNWIQLTIIFPLAGYWEGTGIVDGAQPTKGPDTYSGNDAEYDGYFSEDDYIHFDVFVTATPAPDDELGDFPIGP